MLATCPANLIPLDFIVLITYVEEFNARRALLYSSLQLSVTSSLFSPNILLSTLFLNILKLCSSLNIGDKVSHPDIITGTWPSRLGESQRRQ
jgi:hypothetical protein